MSTNTQKQAARHHRTNTTDIVETDDFYKETTEFDITTNLFKVIKVS